MQHECEIGLVYVVDERRHLGLVGRRIGQIANDADLELSSAIMPLRSGTGPGEKHQANGKHPLVHSEVLASPPRAKPVRDKHEREPDPTHGDLDGRWLAGVWPDAAGRPIEMDRVISRSSHRS